MSLWSERWKWWGPALLFFALNLGLLSMYRLVYAGRVGALEQGLLREQGHLKSLTDRRAEMEARKQRAAATRTRIEELYHDRFATESERLTRTIAEVKALARRAGLVPDAIVYPVQKYAEFGAVKKEVVFSVAGTYPALRQLINFLELSESFVTLEQVSLNEDTARSAGLHIELRLGMLFEDQGTGAAEEAPAPGAARPSPTPPAHGARPAAGEDGP